MSGLIKIREMAVKYDISARALKYYEEMGLIKSTRSEDYAYRMYDEAAVQLLEQILILRKLIVNSMRIGPDGAAWSRFYETLLGQAARQKSVAFRGFDATGGSVFELIHYIYKKIKGE